MSTSKEVKVTFRGIDKTREAFGKIKQNFKQLQNQLKSVSFGFGKIGTALTTAFGIHQIKKIIDTGAEIGKLSEKLDVSTNSLSELKYASEKCGVEFDVLTSSMQEMNAKIADAASGSSKAGDALALLGLSAKELAALAPNEQLSLIANELLRVTNETDRAALAINLFGSKGADLLPLLDQGAVGIAKFQEEARKLGASLSSEQCEAMVKFTDELNKLQTVLTYLMTNLLVPILPLITAFFESLREGHPAVTFIVTALSSLLALKLAAWFVSSVSAIRVFTVALTATPYGLVVAAISTVIAALASLVSWFRRSSKSAKEYNEVLKETRLVSNITIPKQSVEVLKQRNDLQREAKRIFEQTRTPLEKHNAQVDKLNKLLKQGLVDQDTYNRAMSKNLSTLEQTSDKSKETFSAIKDDSNSAANSLIDNFADSIFGTKKHVTSLKETFSDFFRQLQADLLKLTLKEALIGGGSGGGGGLLSGLFGGGGMGGSGGGSFGGLFGGLGNMFAGFFASGGKARAGKAHVVGDGGEPELFIPNTNGNIVPFSSLDQGGASNNIVVNMNIQTPDVASFNYSRSQIAADMARQISRSSRNL